MPKKILIADNSPTIRNVAESLLKKHGYEVFLADNGAKALETARLEKPEIIFLDHSLPILNGEQICNELEQSESLRHIPVIMMISQDKVQEKMKLESLGVKAFIVKPFSPKEILDQVESILQTKGESGIKGKAGNVSSAKGRSKSGLDILETSDLMEDFDQSVPVTEKAGIHGFDWFMSELQKEIQEGDKPELHPKEKSLPAVKKMPGGFEGVISMPPPAKLAQDKSQITGNQFQAGDTPEDFVEDLRRELEQLITGEETVTKPPASKQSERFNFELLLADLKDKISEKVALEVTKMITPEFLEKIIREEIARIKEHIT